MLPTLWFYQVAAQATVGPGVWDGICLEAARCISAYMCMGVSRSQCAFGCVVHLGAFLGTACAAKHTDVSFGNGYQ